MNTISKIAGVRMRGLLIITALSLCACSALQIDVDVYKGPLSNQADIQLKQYAGLAIAARPIIVAMRNEAINGAAIYGPDTAGKIDDAKCLKNNDGNSNPSTIPDQDKYLSCELKLNIPKFLNDVLADYEDGSVENGSGSQQDKLEEKSQQPKKKRELQLKKLKEFYLEMAGQPSLNVEGAPRSQQQTKELPPINKTGIITIYEAFSSITTDYGGKKDRKYWEAVNLAKARLNDKLILFAEKILFVVNNRDLANLDASTGRKDDADRNSFARKMAVLQGLGNTLIVHADDLRKQELHGARLKDRLDSELIAAKSSFSFDATSAYELILSEMKASLNLENSEKGKLENEARGKNGTVVKTQAEIDQAKEELRKNVEKVLPGLVAYRTVFDSYDIKSLSVPDEDKVAKQDRAETTNQIKNTEGNKSIKDVIGKLQAWFVPEKITPPNKVEPFDPQYARRKKAKEYLDNLAASLPPIPDGTASAILDSLKKRMQAELGPDKRNLETKSSQIKAEQSKLASHNNITAARNKADRQEKIVAAIESVKMEVIQKAKTEKTDGVADIKHYLEDALAKQVVAGKPETEKFQWAKEALTQIRPPKTNIKNIESGNADTQLDVLDNLIALLRYQLIQATSGGLTETAANLKNALKIALEQRGGLAYLRPASTYLRDAYSNTSAQDGNSTRSNLLISPFFADLFQTAKNYDSASSEAKRELDKQFWQNINSVKLNGGGSTEFAVVKDDVGNWYVKGFSSDPESIIKSAKSLALFNKGSDINLNLLGQLEDRRALAKLPIDSPDRAALQDKLDAKQAGSGANTSALGKVLDRYRKEYVGSTTADVDSLIGKLNQMQADITSAWQTINFGETKDREASLATLATILGTPAELVVTKNTLMAAQNDLTKAATSASGVTASTSETANANASNAIVTSLREVRNMRSRLVKEINQNDALISTRRNEYEFAKRDFNTMAAEADKMKKLKAEADVNVRVEQARFDGAPPPKDGTKDRAILDRAISDQQIAGQNLGKVNDEVEKLRIAVKSAEDAFTLAKANRSAAARKVSLLVDSLIETATTKRLDSVKAYETAIGFVGETAGAQ